jgi:hypothetical protein
MQALRKFGFLEAVEKRQIEDPKIDFIEKAIFELKHQIQVSGCPPEERDVVRLLETAQDILLAGQRFTIVYECELSHEEVCGRCSGDTSCWGNCPNSTTVIDRPRKLELLTIA